MRALTLLLAILCSCDSPASFVPMPAAELPLYRCGADWCLRASIGEMEIDCLYDTGANGELWLSRETAAMLGLPPRYCAEVSNTFGGGTVTTCVHEQITACAGDRCWPVAPYSVEMEQQCLWGLA